MQKKNWIIVSLSLIIILLVIINITGDYTAQVAIDKISAERNELIRSNSITERELASSLSTVGRLQDIINATDRQLKQLLDDIARGNEETEDYLAEYGEINRDFADFIQQNEPME